ncbi:MAG: hypothetical protein HOP19_18985 [Acidobacteria bacterium]|nr:hypothetical protein [Acidobacteriota bacterium]
MPRNNPFVKNAFIIRPFGKKPVDMLNAKGEKEVGATYDFDQVEKALLSPALAQLGISGRTTIELMRAGNIREDMFHRLLTADLVIADLSIHNANVYYELGLRHAFRDKHTFMLRCEGLSTYPFDLQTDRYFVYHREDPARSLPQLISALEETIMSERADSPVYQLLPNLTANDRSRFLTPPREFSEAVERAKKVESPGDLRLLAVESEGFIWEIEGLREVGRAQFELNFHWGARATWEMLRRHYPDDLEANLVLTRIYQRLFEHSEEAEMQAKSSQALERLRSQREIARIHRSELLALLGRQIRTEWISSWDQLPADQLRAQALSSPLLVQAYESYADAFYEDLNNYNAGLNALSLLMVQHELARALPETWQELSDAPDVMLETLARQVAKLKSAVALSLESERPRLARERQGKRDFWLELHEASFYCLTSTQRMRVRQEFDEAFRLAPPAWIEALTEVLNVYVKLGVFTENVNIALEQLQRARLRQRTRLTVPKPVKAAKKRIILFAGHRVDNLTPTHQLKALRRAKVRFPQDKASLDKATEAIRAAIQQQGDPSNILFGMAGGANGGEILFHEACHALGIKTRLYLAGPRDEFVGQFVSLAQSAGEWYERFDALYHHEQVEERIQLADTLELPRWLQLKPHYDIRRRAGLWMLQHALVNRVLYNAEVVLLVLWSGEELETPGTLDDLMKRAIEKGIKLVVLKSKEVFGE